MGLHEDFITLMAASVSQLKPGVAWGRIFSSYFLLNPHPDLSSHQLLTLNGKSRPTEGKTHQFMGHKVLFLQKFYTFSRPGLLSTNSVGKDSFPEAILRRFPKEQKLLPHRPRV